MKFSNEQLEIVNSALQMLNDPYQDLFEISGIAGSGKTTLVKFIVDEFINSSSTPINVLGCALTGQAVSVLQSKGIPAKTIHSLIYQSFKQKTEEINEYLDTPKYQLGFKKKSDLSNIDLLIIDEAYMIGEDIANDLKSFKHIKKIACGDFLQLPPISGAPGFLTSPNTKRLTKPFRTDNTSGIYLLSSDIINDVDYINNRYNNVEFIKYDNLTDDILLASDVVITSRNKTKYEFNDRVRRLKFFKNSEPCRFPLHGEKIVFKKNNASIKFNDISLVNGMVGTVMGEVFKVEKSSFYIHFKPDLIDVVLPIKCDSKYFFADHNQKQYLRSYSKFNNGEYVEFAYASTIHSYQGSQAANVVYIDESRYFERSVRKAMNYTAVTRATDKLVYVYL